MKHVLQNILAWFARRILKKYRPKIIGITGSVGKTSSKEAIFAVVSQKYRAYRPLKNFNNEFGLPFAIIGVDSPGKSIFKWLGVFAKACGLILFRHKYPEVLILEYGIDTVGDMDHLLSIAQPHIAVITSIGVSHYEFLKDEDTIEREKGKITQNLKEGSYLIVNADSPRALAQKSKTHAKVLSYSMKQSSDIAVTESQEYTTKKYYTKLKVRTPLGNMDIEIAALGAPHAHAALAAVAVGQALDVEQDLIVQGVALYRPAPGRLNVIAGIKHTTIIDDTYNAADPIGVKEALALQNRLEASHKLTILGTMRELGALSGSAHEEIGKLVATMKIDKLIAIGDGGQQIADSALAAGFPKDKILTFQDADTAKSVVQDILVPESLVLIKGSQYVRLEKITKEIMAEPMRALELLCRQDESWLKK